MTTLLLVHGAWCGSWAWDRLVPELELEGIASKVINLPGHGAKSGSMWSVSLADYADAVIDGASSIEGSVIAVGHSMGGLVISEAAAKAPKAFQALTYLAAFLPCDGERLISLSSKDKQSKLNSLIKPRLFKGSTVLDTDGVDAALFNGCSPEEAQQGKSLLQENPMRPSFSRVHLNHEFELIPKHYIRCTADQSISPEHQQWMAGRYKTKSMQDIDGGHMANYSAPRPVARALAKIVAMEAASD